MLNNQVLQVTNAVHKAVEAAERKNELAGRVLAALQPALEVAAIVITLIEGNYFQLFQAILPSDGKARPIEKQGDIFPISLSPYALLSCAAEYSTQIRKVNSSDLGYRDFAGTHFVQAAGLEESMLTLLRYRGQIVGHLEVFSKKSGTFSAGQFPLLEMLAQPIAAALAYTQIREGLAEKATLLSLSGDMATIRDKDDLYRVMMEKIRPLIDFNDAVVVIFEKDTYNYFFNLAPAERRANPFYDLLARKTFPFKNSPFEFFIQQDNPFFLTTEQMLQRFPGYPGFIFMQQTGLHYSVKLNLLHGGEIFGLILLHFNQASQIQPAKIPLYQAFTDQLAVAVYNILANRDILEREQERTILLSLSEAMTTIRDKDDLYRVMMEKIRPLIDFDDAVVVILREKAYSYFFNLASTERQAHPLFKKLTRQSFPIQGSPFEVLLEQEGPFPWSAQELLKSYQGNDDLTLMQQTGLQNSVNVPLVYGGQRIGLVLFHFHGKASLHPALLNLYKALTGQLAVAVSNILANEEIASREGEKSLQITLTNVLTREEAWEKKWWKVIQLLEPYLPLDYVVFRLKEGEQLKGDYTFYRTGFEEYQLLDPAHQQHLCGLSAEKYDKLPREQTLREAMILNGEDLVRWGHQYTVERLTAQHFQLQSHFRFPLLLSRDNALVFSFYSKQVDAYQAEHLAFMSRIAYSLSLTLDKLLAYEEVKKLSEQLKQEKSYLMEEVKTTYNFEQLIGTSTLLQRVFHSVANVAPTDTTVLIQGETGTGKELIARAIHHQSPRRERPLIKVNCAALPAQLIESEFFGHEKGAFTGAVERRIGKFEMANQGTIFLDEIGELALELQAKLLRVLQEKEIERIGGKSTIPVDFRVIAATNRDLAKAVLEGKFRSDLFYRLHIFPIQLPSLRERNEDIPLLATYFAQRFSKKMGRPFLGITANTLSELLAYDWPGNIRELENVMEQSVILSEQHPLEWSRPPAKRSSNIQLVTSLPNEQLLGQPDNGIKAQRESWEKAQIMQALQLAQGRIRGTEGAAERLGIKATTLEAKMKKLGIYKEHVLKS
ncbi:sigma 54-interacting transcriptional regulator [Adhaeribacter radiodurans]|uniref:Sigma-54-dependent Fis family transcriptional regulator n=1 Tax=Adhaeribacter radiodurans TaxID=2745197 RepID=A0A7L7LAM5_9BACT|nr:sigma 54-interacting transcriptional regulator [Adhaeribacter radiodurans]QMU29764.1 sigma-54-dependent Fis family transcriptional regulator [Adhaeribacter radiodurans]